MLLLLFLLHVRYIKGPVRKRQLPERIPTSPKDSRTPQDRGYDFCVHSQNHAIILYG